MSTFQNYLSSVKNWTEKKVSNTKRYLLKNKKSSLITLVVSALLLGGCGIGYTYYQSQVQSIYHVYFHNEKVGVIDDPDVVNEWLERKLKEESSKYEHVQLQQDDRLHFEEERLFRPTFDNQATLKEISNLFSLQASAVKIVIDGEVIGFVTDEETLSRVVDEYKGQYVSEYVSDEFLPLHSEEKDKKATISIASLNYSAEGEESNIQKMDNNNSSGLTPLLEIDKPKVTSAEFKQDIELQSVDVHPSQVMNEEELIEKLSASKVEETVYHVQPGDVLGSIAQKHDLTLRELLELNPEFTGNELLQIDQEIIVTADEPMLTVVTVERVKQEEQIAYSTKMENSSELYRGERRTKQEGKNGKKLVVYEITKENGMDTNKEPVEAEVVEEPVEEIILVGTKEKPSRGTGKFQWPAVGGVITSGFGQRWGRPHNGVDISGVRDRGILAADNGKVVKAEFHRTYGNHILIDHGNGYQTLYAHLESMGVGVGAVVEKGERIGVMGTTGRSTGIHLHFEVIKNGRSVNPLPYLNR